MTTYKDLLRIFSPYNIPFSSLFQKCIDYFAGATSQNDPELYTYNELCEMMDKNNVEPNRLYKFRYTPLIISDVYETNNYIYNITLKGKTENSFYDEININNILTNDYKDFTNIDLIEPLILNCVSTRISEIKSITLTTISVINNVIIGYVTGFANTAQYPPIILNLDDLPEITSSFEGGYIDTTIELNKTVIPEEYSGFLGDLTLTGNINIKAKCDNVVILDNVKGVYNFARDFQYGWENKLLKPIKNDIDIYAKPILDDNQSLPATFNSNLYFLKATADEIVFTTSKNNISKVNLIINKNDYKFSTIIPARMEVYLNNELDGSYNFNFILYDIHSYNGYITNINYKTKNNKIIDIDYDFFNYVKIVDNDKYKMFNMTIYDLLQLNHNIILKSNRLIPYILYKNKNHKLNSFDIESYESKENTIQLLNLTSTFSFPISGKIYLNNSNNNTILIPTHLNDEAININVDILNSLDNKILITYKNTTVKNCQAYDCSEIRTDVEQELFYNGYHRNCLTLINCKDGSIDTEWLSENMILENIEGSNVSIQAKTSNPWAFYCRGKTHIRNITPHSRFILEIYTAAQSVSTFGTVMFDGFDGIFIPTSSFVHKWVTASRRLYDIIPFNGYNPTGDEIDRNTGYLFKSENNTFEKI